MTNDEFSRGLIALKQICKSVEGRQAMRFLLEDTGFFMNSNSGDPYQDAFANGRRSVMLAMDSYVGRDAFLQILKEPL